MIIDIHTHTFPDKLASTTIPKLEQMSHTKSYVDGTNGGLMASSGVEAAVTLLDGGTLENNLIIADSVWIDSSNVADYE